MCKNLIFITLSFIIFSCSSTGPVTIIEKEINVDIKSLAKKNLLFVIKSNNLEIDNPLINFVSKKIQLTQDEYSNIIKEGYKKCLFNLVTNSTVEEFSLPEDHWYKYLKSKANIDVMLYLKKSTFDVSESWSASGYSNTGVYDGSFFTTTFLVDVYSYGKYAMSLKLYHSEKIEKEKEVKYDQISIEHFKYLMNELYRSYSSN